MAGTRDESLHVESLMELFHADSDERPHLWTPALKAEVGAICATMVGLEDGFIDPAFQQGGIDGLTPYEVKSSIRFVADRRMQGLGIDAPHQVQKNPLP